jgi:hypothetical protein
MVVDQIHVSGILAFEAEDYAPVGTYGDGPEVS